MPDETTRTEIMGEPGILRVEIEQTGAMLSARLIEAQEPYLCVEHGNYLLSAEHNEQRELLLCESARFNPTSPIGDDSLRQQWYGDAEEASKSFDRIRAAIAHYCAEWKRKMNGVMVEVDPSSEFNAAPQTDNPSAESDGAFAIRMWRDLFGRIEIGRLGAMVELQPGGGPPLDDALRLAQLVKGAPHA